MMLMELLKERNLSIYKLSKLSEVPYSTLSDIVSGKTELSSVSVGTLSRISQVLGVSMDHLYYGKSEAKPIYLYNDGRQIHIEYEDLHFSFMGPKNLVALKSVNRVIDGCAHINAYYKDEKIVYVEEEYVDIRAEFMEYGYIDRFPDRMVLKLEKPGESRTDRFVDDALMISDNMAIMKHESSTEDLEIKIVNVARQNARMIMRLKDYAVLMTSMTDTMQHRAIDIVKRNAKLISDLSAEEGSAYA